MRRMLPLLTSLLSASLFLAALPAAHAAPTAAEITGEIERLTLNDPTDIYSGGVMIVGGTQVILPKNLLLDLPANRLTLQQLFDQAPASCKSAGESGIAKADRCNTMGSGGFATLSGVNSTAGNVIAGDVLIEKGKETVSGVVTYLNYNDGYFRVNGTLNDSSTGVMVRLNDPTGRHTVQQGLGCAGGPNCSADPRFTLDPDNYVSTFTTGYPLCIPSTVVRQFPGLPAATGIPAIPAGPTSASAGGTGDLLCPSTNRTPGVVVEPPVADSRRFAPLMVGDSVQAEGNYESVAGARFLSSHTTRINRALQTRNVPDQPDYLFLEEVFMEAPGFQNQRARMLIIGFATLATPATDVDFWTIHRDPASNAVHEFPLASIQGCDIAAGAGSCSSQGLIGAGGNIFRIRYDVDFLLAGNNAARYPGGARNDLNPCWQLLNSPRFAVSNPGLCPGGSASTGAGITLASNFGIMSPIPHEIQARTGHLLDNPGLATVTLDVNGKPATNGQYLFPFGMNLGGIETADFLEIDVNLLNTPRLFEGIPWNLDRRLSPGGCLKGGACESTPQPLDPFPYTGLDPRLQAEFLVAGQAGGTPKGPFEDPNYTHSILSNASNRVFSFVSGTPFAGVYNFDGNNTLLGCATGACPPDPGPIPIVAPPPLSIFPPVVDEDLASTRPGVPVTIDVLANDVAVLGAIDPTSVKITFGPPDGIATVNPLTGAVTYTPGALAAGTVTFAYTVASTLGAVSLPGPVSVTILDPPVAVPDSATASVGASVLIPVLANDSSTTPINPASLAVTAANGGSAAANLNGTVTYTAPAVPGSYSFSYTFRDGSATPALSNSALVTVTVTALPTGSLVLNGGAAASSTTTGTATLSATSPNGAVTQMQFSWDGVSYFPWESYATSRSINLAYIPGDGVKTLYARFKDAIGNISAPVTDSVRLDTTGPAGTIAFTTPNPTTGSTGTLALTATDPSGAAQMQFSHDGVNYFAWETFATTRTVSLPVIGLNTIWVRYKDGLGNVSAAGSASITRN